MTNDSEKISLQAVIPESMDGSRLDQALAQLFPDYSRTRLQEWIKRKQVTVDGQHRRSKDKVYANEHIDIQAELQAEIQWQAQPIDLDIIYEDEDVLLINKPAGMVVHPAAGNPDSTLVNALLNHDATLEQLPRAGIIHRLDKDTSGILAIPRTLTSHAFLVDQLQQRLFTREYQAIVRGSLIAGSTIDAPIARHPTQRKRMAIISSGKPAITHYRVVERYNAYTLLKVNLETGRTHQIRVHMEHIKHPILGDPVYGDKRLQLPPKASDKLKQTLQQFKRQALHARLLGFTHPRTKEYMQWEAALPTDMQSLVQLLQENVDNDT